MWAAKSLTLAGGAAAIFAAGTAKEIGRRLRGSGRCRESAGGPATPYQRCEVAHGVSSRLKYGNRVEARGSAHHDRCDIHIRAHGYRPGESAPSTTATRVSRRWGSSAANVPKSRQMAPKTARSNSPSRTRSVSD